MGHWVTPRQKQLLRLIVGPYLSKKRPPSYKEMAEAMGIASTNAIRNKIAALQALGYVTHEYQEQRGVIPTEKALSLTWNVISLPTTP